jgi:signal transduction histidine kinase
MSSRSLWDRALPHLDSQAEPERDGTRKSYVQGPEDQRLRLVERNVDLGDEGRFLVAVGGDAVELDDEILAFDGAIATTFVVLAVVLLLTTLFQVRFGLAPLNRISRGLAAIRSGKAEKLEGNFPDEIAPLARETNALIDANREIVERARTHVGNLAHALKTPLSVMVNEASTRPDDPLAVKVREQTDIMRDQVTRHLERARLAARMAVVGSITDVVPVVQALARTLEKTHHDKNLTIDLDLPGEARFRGERQDLEEMVGNLIDNACKWASARVSIEVLLEQPEPGRQVVRIVVDDDGPGLSPAQREQVARRGQRLDETKPGSGLGLSIVVELATLYGGALNLGTAPIGGLRAELALPGG